MTRFSITILKGADSDTESAIEWYEDQKQGLGFNFYREFHRLTQLLADNPFLFQEHYLFVRRAVFTGFPFSLFYAIDEVNFVVEVIAILHQKMSPAELKRRINAE